MNSRALILLLITLTSLPGLARKADMQKEAEKYIRYLLREVPELAGDKSSRKAREAILADYKRHDILALSAAQRKTIEDRDNPVPEQAYQAAFSKLKDAPRQTDEVKFLLEQVEKDKSDDERRLLLFRLMEHHIKTDQDIRENNLKLLLDASRAYKNQNNKYAPTLADLSLDPDVAHFKDRTGKTHDWIYLGGTPKGVSRKSSRVIFVEPVADSSGNALAINSRGSRFPVNLEQIKQEAAVAAKTPPKKSSPESASKPKQLPDYPQIIESQMKEIMLIYLAKHLAAGKAPSTLEDLQLPKTLTKSPSPDSTASKDWILIPPAVEIELKSKQVVLVAPYPHQDTSHYAATIDGKIHPIEQSAVQKILKKVSRN